MRQRQPRQHDEQHLAFIRQLPCVVCLNNIQTEAAHVRMADPRSDKPPTGMQEKPDDCWALPLCNEHHREQHDVGERRFWAYGKQDPIFICMALARVSGDVEAGERIVRHAND